VEQLRYPKNVVSRHLTDMKFAWAELAQLSDFVQNRSKLSEHRTKGTSSIYKEK
jgi:hypothetical protein